MELKKVKEEEKTIVLEMVGESLTLANLIREDLWKDENVTEAAYIKEHPYLSEPKIFVKVNRGNPINALEKACNRIISQLNEFREKFKEALKS
ncbi:MAG: RpoL/Rpb11 RNA polymerase subunit family protein [Candidatus Aenigmatarchaeota archaeon]